MASRVGSYLPERNIYLFFIDIPDNKHDNADFRTFYQDVIPLFALQHDGVSRPLFYSCFSISVSPLVFVSQYFQYCYLAFNLSCHSFRVHLSVYPPVCFASYARFSFSSGIRSGTNIFCGLIFVASRIFILVLSLVLLQLLSFVSVDIRCVVCP